MLHKDLFEELMNEEEIAKTVDEIAERINRDYAGRELVVVGVLKGSIMFLADLLRKLTLDECQLDFIAASSYGSNSVSSGKVTITKDISCNPIGRDVLLVEDILDTGNTLSFIKEHLLQKGAASVKICTLFDKPSRRKKDITPDYAGKTIEDLFIVGYGLDYSEHYRNLPYVGVLRSEIYS
jgi:hypoxanthine phosphoribosyltransferase